MRLIIYVLTIVIAVVASLTAGILCFWAYVLDEPYLIGLALPVIMAAIPLGVAADKLETNL